MIVKAKLTGLNSPITNVDQKHINDRLWRARPVLLRREKIDDGVREFGAGPAVGGFVGRRVPVEELWGFVLHVAHAAAPAVG